MANSLFDFIRSMFSGNQTDFNMLSKQFEAMGAQLQQPSSLPQPPQRQPVQPPPPPQQTNKTSQSSQVIRQLPVYDRETTPVVINPLTGELITIPTSFPSKSEPKDYPHYKNAEIRSTTTKTKSTKPTKKALTAKTIQQATEGSPSIPILPYTPEGFSEALNQALSQGKISPAQAQQILQTIAPQDLSFENIIATVLNEINKLPDDFKADLAKYEDKMDKAYKDLENNRKQQVEIVKKYADKELELLTKTLQSIEKVFTDLMKEKPNLEPDKWTLFGRQLAMALGAISALAHPGYAPYFYMAIPQVVQYWQNEDMYNFEKAMRKFEFALKLAGTQLDFYNQIMEHNLKILEKQKEKELLPLTLAEQLLMEKYHTYVDIYSKMAPEQYKIISDKIKNTLDVAGLVTQYKHYKAMEDLQRMANEIRLKHLELDAWYKKASLAIRQELANIAKGKFNLLKKLTEHPEQNLKFLISEIGKKVSNPKDLVRVIETLARNQQDIFKALDEIERMDFSLWGED